MWQHNSREGGGEHPTPRLQCKQNIRFIQKKYIEIEKYLYVLIIVSRKLHPYFYTHEITVLPDKLFEHFQQKLNA